jgi:hypothetical protein
MLKCLVYPYVKRLKLLLLNHYHPITIMAIQAVIQHTQGLY